MSYSSQPPTYSSTPKDKKIASNVGATEFPEFSTQMTLGGISGVNEATLGADSSASATRKSVKWTTEQNLVLLSGDSNSVGSTARPMGRDAAKKKAKKKGKSVALEVVNEDFNEFK
ncbi:hypothetical protein BRARA_D00798 [Brassica rapa]|uniref:Uncharacterized protein n=1 Tax=Brassica campestris TaxID=3711 RepID=A0A397ZMP4_BRACM|nr:hypothetical protein BRARA_D00798 [Brassica rapa]